MDENKILAAILTIASSARDAQTAARDVGKQHWRKVIEDYEQILAALKEKRAEPYQEPGIRT